jgi:hypothetical protein
MVLGEGTTSQAALSVQGQRALSPIERSSPVQAYLRWEGTTSVVLLESDEFKGCP